MLTWLTSGVRDNNRQYSSGVYRSDTNSIYLENRVHTNSFYVVIIMGKNKLKIHHRNNHRHMYRKKQQPYKYKKSQPTATVPNGARIIKFQQYTDNISAHATHCEGAITLTGESKQGLASILRAYCSICNQTIIFEVSSKVKGLHG